MARQAALWYSLETSFHALWLWDSLFSIQINATSLTTFYKIGMRLPSPKSQAQHSTVPTVIRNPVPSQMVYVNRELQAEMRGVIRLQVLVMEEKGAGWKKSQWEGHSGSFLSIHSLGSQQARIFLAQFMFIQLIGNHLHTHIAITYWRIARELEFGITRSLRSRFT